MRWILRIAGVVLGAVFIAFAVYYSQLGEETVLKRIAKCATYLLMGVAFLIYGVRGTISVKRK